MTERERLLKILDKTIATKDEDTDDYIEWLADELLANGVIVPPCKVGDIVYAVKGCFYLPHATWIKSTDIIACEIIAIKQTKRNKLMLLNPLIEECYGMRSANSWFCFSIVGKTVFLTKEEAEKGR